MNDRSISLFQSQADAIPFFLQSHEKDPESGATKGNTSHEDQIGSESFLSRRNIQDAQSDLLDARTLVQLVDLRG